MIFPSNWDLPVRPCMPYTIPEGDIDTHDHEDDHNCKEAQAPKIHSVPLEPTPAEIEAHAATHIPYRSWCKWCLQGRRPNQRHVRSTAQRDIPLLVGDYCFVRDSKGETHMTLYVDKLYPSKATAAIPVHQKGRDDYGIKRLANVLKQNGVQISST